MKKINSIHKVTVGTFTLPPHNTTNGYVIGSDGNAVLIDPVYAVDGPLEECLKANKIQSIQFAAITHPHPDHYGGIDELLDAYGGKVLCHPEMAQNQYSKKSDTQRHQVSTGGEVIHAAGHTIEVIYTPGHSAAHLCFYIKEAGILFSGDTILGHGTSIISPPEGNMADYMKTLHMLAAMDIHTICPAHGPVIDQHAAEWIQWYIDHRRMREKRVIEAVKKGYITVEQITEQIYLEADFKMHGRNLLPRAQRSVLAHLDKLEEENVIIHKTTGLQDCYLLA